MFRVVHFCLFFFLVLKCAKCNLIDFPRLSLCLSKLLSMGPTPVRVRGVKRESEKGKWLTASKPLLSVRREQQIGLTYKTLIDL